jgi:putative ABC transport system substrate-binding protein
MLILGRKVLEQPSGKNMRRRDFILLAGGAMFVQPFAVQAAQAGKSVIGFLGSGSPEASTGPLRAFRQGLKEAGHVEGENLTIEYRWSTGYIGLPEMAAELVDHQVGVIVAAAGLPAARAARDATATIPVVFTIGVDPVAIGLVPSLNRPGGNLTGVTNFNLELGQKRLELLHQVMPGATAVALLVNPTTGLAEPLSKDLMQAARPFGLEVHLLQAATEGEIEDAFAKVVELQANALVVGADAYFASRSQQLAALSISHALPVIGSFRPFAVAGGLISYGASPAELYQLAGLYTGKILNGSKPADLPVLQTTRFELIINLKTAKRLGLQIPTTLLGSADEVIE